MKTANLSLTLADMRATHRLRDLADAVEAGRDRAVLYELREDCRAAGCSTEEIEQAEKRGYQNEEN